MSRKTRNLIWSAPLVAAIAVIGALALFLTLTPNHTEAQGLDTPGQPQNFMLEATGPTSIKLTWDEPTDGGRPSAYRIDVSEDGLTWELLEGSWPGQDTEYEHTGLMARQTKYYRMFAHNTGGTKIGPVAFPTTRSATTDASTKPENPTGLTATKGTATPAPEEAVTATRTSITVRWDEPETPPGTTIHQYKVAYAVDPDNLGLHQVRTLKVVDVPTSKADEVYCGHTNGNAGLDCRYTFKGLLEHQTWHYQVYASNEDAAGEVGTSNPSDSESAATDDGLLPMQPTALWAAVNKSSPGVWVYWAEPLTPAGAPVTDYLVQARPKTDVNGTPTDYDVAWANDSSNAIIFHDGKTADLLLTDAELRAAARVAWTNDDTLDDTLRDLDALGTDFNKYFANLEWEFRVFALNRVWEREVKDVAAAYNELLGPHGADFENLPVTFPTEGNITNDVPINVSDVLLVSLNELDLFDDQDPPQLINIAPNRINLQRRIANVSAEKDSDTNGGRTKIDLEWDRTYSHEVETEIADDDEKRYATAYRVQWSTDPDSSDWNLLDADAGAEGHQDFAATTGTDPICNTDGECTVSHEGLYAGTSYTYRVFARNEPADGVITVNAQDGNSNGTVFSWWQRTSMTTSDAEKPGIPRMLTAERSLSDGHTMIDVSWNPPAVDADGEGEGDGHGIIIKYVIQKSDDGGNTWIAHKTVNTETACSGTPANGATHKLGTDKYGPVEMCTDTHTMLGPGQTVRYRVASMNIGPREKMSDWSNSATHTTEESTKPDKPEGLVAEAMGRGMINLMWNIQSRTPPAAPILAYIIEYMTGDTWTQLARISDADAADNQNDKVRTIHTDTGLASETERTYRVRAQNEPKVGEMDVSEESDNAMATTAASPPNADPVDGPDLTATVTAGDMTMIQSTISDPDGASDLTWDTMASSTAPTIATATVDATTGMVTITGHMAGEATITVTATDIADATATQDIMVTVEAAEPAEPEEVGPATGVTTGPFNVGGVIQVNWGAAPNATGYIIYAVNVDELDDANGQIVVAAENDGTADTFNLSGLNVGDTYDIYVVATVKEMVAWPTSADVVQVEAE